MNAQEFAKVVLAQLGGNKFIAMTGAKNFLYSQDDMYMSFKLPSRFAKDGINYVKISLTPMDTYNIEFGKTHGMNYKVISTLDGIYADNLREMFTQTTGLDTSMGAVTYG